MKLLSTLHRWTGGLIGFLLALLGLSGAILVWEDQWIALPHSNEAIVQDAAALARVAEGAGPGLSRITFADDGMSLHQLVLADGAGAYVAQDGQVVDRWQSQWERPELWLFDFHHHLFTGETGEWVTGIAGLVGLLFVVTGLILWWRSRRAFRLRLLPAKFKPGPIVSHHRDLGLIASPLLLTSLATGVLMLFAPVRMAMLGAEERPGTTLTRKAEFTPESALTVAERSFPGARIRRLTLPSKSDGPISVRLRQPFEWTPNGRTQVLVATDGTVTVEDSAAANRSAWLAEKLYPIHSGKTGSWLWKLAMTLSGLVLATLGGLTTWSFWKRRADRRRPRPAPSRSALPHAQF